MKTARQKDSAHSNNSNANWRKQDIFKKVTRNGNEY